jgi:hypothetical protein
MDSKAALRLLLRWGWTHGVQARIARALRVSERTISRDLSRQILPLCREGVDGQLHSRYWSKED